MSKPEIIVQSFEGINNKNLQATKDRLYKGGSWRKQNVIILIPTSDLIPAKVVLSWMNLAGAPNNGMHRKLLLGMEVGEAYSYAIEEILNDPVLSKWQYILTLEHDMCPPPDGLLMLLEEMEIHPELSCISGGYFTKGPSAILGPDGKMTGGGCFQAWGDPKLPEVNYMPQLPDLNGGLVECCGLGMGFALFRLDIFKDPRLRRPWFKTQKERDANGNFGIATQDLYFWSDARKYGYRCAVLSKCKVGHYDYSGAFGVPDTMY